MDKIFQTKKITLNSQYLLRNESQAYYFMKDGADMPILCL